MSSLGAISESKRITSSLRNARMQIESNVLQIGDAKDIVDEDGELIQEANDEHRFKLKDSLRRTRMSMRKLKISEIQEKYGVMIALCFLSLTALFIVLRRLRVLALCFFLFGYVHKTENNRKIVAPAEIKEAIVGAETEEAYTCFEYGSCLTNPGNSGICVNSRL